MLWCPETCLCCPNERVATTGSAGEFEFYGLEPGTYGATAELEGFASVSGELIRLGSILRKHLMD